MPKHKITFEFEATVGNTATSGSKSGWTESWYDPSDNSDDAASFAAIRLKNWRRKLLTPGWSVTAIRGSRLDANNNLIRKGFLIFVSPADGIGQFPGANMDEQPYDCLEVRIVSANGNHRSFGMRGIPQSVINAGGRYVAPADFVPAFNDWVNFGLVVGEGDIPDPFAIRIRTAGGRANILKVIIDPAVEPTASGAHPYVVLDGNVGFAVGQTVNILGVQGMTRINGNWIIDRLVPLGGANTPAILLKPKRRLTVGGVYAGGGTAVSWAYVLDNITTATAGYGTSRRTGRPPILVRGRRSSRTS